MGHDDVPVTPSVDQEGTPTTELRWPVAQRLTSDVTQKLIVGLGIIVLGVVGLVLFGGARIAHGHKLLLLTYAADALLMWAAFTFIRKGRRVPGDWPDLAIAWGVILVPLLLVSIMADH